MRLKRLVARGFKSFADRTEFEFDSRLTGIIGPNGCGKSNVVDAIKWVLGDQRARSLRGSEMTDVIFKGAEGRERMGMAEVTITFEDDEGRFDGRTEIDIARRLTLEKESSYLLNGEEVRLKDVRETLFGTGLGTGGYSVMEQGRIDAVLSANPEARRAIFEEAAGIARFKLQKRESLRKLERTDQNLSRVTDLLEERARRIRSLKIQAGKARRWQQLEGELRDLRAAVAVVEGTELRRVLAEQNEQLAELESGRAAAEQAREQAHAQVKESEAGIARCTVALEAARSELHESRGELTQHQERGEAQRQRAADLGGEAERGRQRIANLQAQQGERGEELRQSREALVKCEAELIELHRRLEEQRELTRKTQSQLRDLQDRRERVRELLLELLHVRTRARNAAADQEALIAASRVRGERLRARHEVLDQEQQELVSEESSQRAELGDVHTRERILQERQVRALEDLRKADAAAAELAEEESTLRTELS
ncbi:MAG: AAA family ATPase, partial [Planctomycetota bacterium]|nr:AAA family ATPase [Planctomycetota bacterium]